MSKAIIDIIGGIIFTVMGLWFVIYHKSLGTKAGYWNQKFYRLLHFQVRYTEKTIKGIQIMYLIGGIVFVILGVLAFGNIIRFK